MLRRTYVRHFYPTDTNPLIFLPISRISFFFQIWDFGPLLLAAVEPRQFQDDTWDGTGVPDEHAYPRCQTSDLPHLRRAGPEGNPRPSANLCIRPRTARASSGRTERRRRYDKASRVTRALEAAMSATATRDVASNSRRFIM